jgi:hypothetical protein
MIERRIRSKETAEGPEPQTKIQSRLAREVEVLQRCIERNEMRSSAFCSVAPQHPSAKIVLVREAPAVLGRLGMGHLRDTLFPRTP